MKYLLSTIALSTMLASTPIQAQDAFSIMVLQKEMVEKTNQQFFIQYFVTNNENATAEQMTYVPPINTSIYYNTCSTSIAPKEQCTIILSTTAPSNPVTYQLGALGICAFFGSVCQVASLEERPIIRVLE